MKQQSKRLQIAYTCNDKMFNALYLSILSIVKRTKSAIDFYLFSANLTEMSRRYISLTPKHENAIRDVIKKYSPKSTFTIVDCKDYYYLRLNKHKARTRHWTPYATFRLLFDMIKQINGIVLYLDPDTMACDDISKAFNVDMKKYELCVTKDIYTWDKRLEGKYFNSGVLLMNLDLIRKTKYLEKAFRYMIEKNPKFCDQDALNWTGKYIKYRTDDRFNRIWESRQKTTVIKHFAGPCPKPWKRKFIKKSKELNYGIWMDDIVEWKKMKSKL